MSGHSKWAQIKRQKGAADQKRGAAFTKLANTITLAAKEGGGSMESNFKLRLAVEKAKSLNMPKDNIEKAIKRGTGEISGGQVEEVIYEGFGPAKSQYIVKSLTDNKNRSAAGIRHIFSKFGGGMGSVMWNFRQQGVIRISRDCLKEKDGDEEFQLRLIDAGAQDIKKEEEGLTLLAKPEDLQKIKAVLEEQKIESVSAEVEFVSREPLKIIESEKIKVDKFNELLEDNEDVSEYYSNIEI